MRPPVCASVIFCLYSSYLEDLLLDDVGHDVRDGGVRRAHRHHVQLGDLEAVLEFQYFYCVIAWFSFGLFCLGLVMSFLGWVGGEWEESERRHLAILKLFGFGGF